MKHLPILFHIVLSSLFSTVSGFREVFGRYSKDVVLPCSTPSFNGLIHWQRPTKQLEILVHSYYRGQDQLERQAVEYQNRTTLFYDDLPKGNVSLLLRHLRLEDEGIYKCYTGIEYQVLLTIIAFKSSSMSYDKQNMTTVLQCAAWGVHPLPNISWSDASGFIHEITNRTEMQADGLTSVISELNITNSSQVYQCRVQNSFINLNWTGVWNVPVTLHEEEGKEALLPCGVPHTLNLSNLHATWMKANQTHLTFFENLTYDVEKSRVARVPVENNQTNFSIILKDLTVADSGDYVCNISSQEYMQLTLLALSVDKRTNERINIIVKVIMRVAAFVVATAALICIYIHHRRRSLSENNRPHIEMEMKPLQT